jgi:hypothetical protein
VGENQRSGACRRNAVKKVLFVTYGSGHVKMVLPVAQVLAAEGSAEVRVLGLTTAAAPVREAGLELLQFADFAGADEEALAHGKRLLATLEAPAQDVRESMAYLGLSFSDLVQEVGHMEAEARYRRFGRQAFLPVRTLERILSQVAPDLVVATNSPRGERAAILAARHMGIPSVCIVDLFAVDEVRWIGAPDYADRVCVLNEAVRQFLIDAGRLPSQVVVTGNPAFDILGDPAIRQRGLALRHRRGGGDRKVLLWPMQTEPLVHPFDGRPGDPSLPQRALASVAGWVMERQDRVLCVRPRAGEAPPAMAQDARIVVTGQDWNLAELLHAVDLVATLNSTVGLEGHLAGTRVLQVLGSVFDEAMPMRRFGIADEAVAVDGIAAALGRLAALPRSMAREAAGGATQRVTAEIRAFL